MPTYDVEIETTVLVTVTVDADDAEKAEEQAVTDFQGLTSYAGNGGCDKLVGVEENNMSLDPACHWECVDVMEVG